MLKKALLVLMAGLLFLPVIGCLNSDKVADDSIGQKGDGGSADRVTENDEQPPTRQIIVYFSDKEGEYLLPEVREVATTDAEKTAVTELASGPNEAEHVATIPEGTRVLDVHIENETALVNFSNEFVDNHPGGSAAELLTVYSVVNSLTEFGAVERVRFLVEGKSVDTLAGHLDLSEPVSRHDDLIYH